MREDAGRGARESLKGQDLRADVNLDPGTEKPRAARDGELPPGISIVSFAAAETRCLRGPAGEILELVEAR